MRDAKKVFVKAMAPVPLNIEVLFKNGMGRYPGGLWEPLYGDHVNLGSGNSPIPDMPPMVRNVHNLDRPDWEAPVLPFANNSVAAVHAYHFLEHLPSDTVRHQLAEVDRVLYQGGVMWICVPHAASICAFQDIDHKSFWTEETLPHLLDNGYYDATYRYPTNLHIQFQFIAGVAARNLCLLAQLVKH